MVQENLHPHPYAKALEQLMLCLVRVHVEHIHFDVELFFTGQDSLFMHVQPGIVILFVKL
jgi:hypothetical protein